MYNQLQKKTKNFLKKNDEIAYRLKVATLKFSGWASNYIDDEKYIKQQYKRKTGKSLNLDEIITYNEKIQWMKLNYKNPLLNQCVDKFEVRNYVSKKIENAETMLIPMIGVYDSIEDVDFEKLPKQFIMKLTNGSSFNYICLDKNRAEIDKIKRRFKSWIKLNYYTIGREWAYKDVKNRIICEELLLSESGNPPEDYRFFCFGGQLKFVAVDMESVKNGKKNSDYYRNLYGRNWDFINAEIEYPNDIQNIHTKPACFEEMIDVAEKLAEDFPAVRVDFYYLNNKYYFSELTFYHASGYQNIKPLDFDKKMGEWINLNNVQGEDK